MICLIQGYKVTGAVRSGDSVTVSLEKKDGSSKEDVTADVVLVSVGRRPYTDNLGLESVGIVKDDKGRVPVNGHFQTIVPRFVCYLTTFMWRIVASLLIICFDI